MKKLASIAIILMLALLIPFATQVMAAAGTILESSFETVSNWAYTESDTDFTNGVRSEVWKTQGTYSYLFSATDTVTTGNKAYCQIVQSVDFTGLDTFSFDANLYASDAAKFTASVLVGSTEVWSQGCPTTATDYLRQEVDISGYTGTLDFTFRVTANTGTPNIALNAYFDNIKTWGSYDDSSQTNVWGTVTNPYTETTQTAYVYGRNFDSAIYAVGFYDGDGDKVGSDVSGTLDGTNLSAQFVLNTDPNATPGTWYAAVFDTAQGSPPTTHTNISSAPGYVIEDDFEVLASAIPEFPTVLAVIGIAGLCFGIYWWMRKRMTVSR